MKRIIDLGFHSCDLLDRKDKTVLLNLVEGKTINILDLCDIYHKIDSCRRAAHQNLIVNCPKGTLSSIHDLFMRIIYPKGSFENISAAFNKANPGSSLLLSSESFSSASSSEEEDSFDADVRFESDVTDPQSAEFSPFVDGSLLTHRGADFKVIVNQEDGKAFAKELRKNTQSWTAYQRSKRASFAYAIEQANGDLTRINWEEKKQSLLQKIQGRHELRPQTKDIVSHLSHLEQADKPDQMLIWLGPKDFTGLRSHQEIDEQLLRSYTTILKTVEDLAKKQNKSTVCVALPMIDVGVVGYLARQSILMAYEAVEKFSSSIQISVEMCGKGDEASSAVLAASTLFAASRWEGVAGKQSNFAFMDQAPLNHNDDAVSYESDSDDEISDENAKLLKPGDKSSSSESDASPRRNIDWDNL